MVQRGPRLNWGVWLHSSGKQQHGMRLTEEETTMWYSALGCLVTLALTILLAPLASDGLATANVPRIGFLSITESAAAPAVLEPFRHGLRARGYVEGQTMVLEVRWAEGSLDRLPALATELVQLP